MATLEIVAGGRVGEVHELIGEQTLVGRFPTCDVVFPLHTISRRHCRVVHAGAAYYIEDLGSLNGTYVNGQRIDKPTILKDQDVIQLYDVVLIFHQDPSRRNTVNLDDSAVQLTLQLLADDSTNPPKAREVVNASSVASESHVHVSPDVKLRAVLEITRSLTSSTDLDDILKTILDNSFNVFPQANRGYILLAESPSGELTPRALKRRDQADTFGPISRTIAERVMSRREAILSANVLTDDWLDGSDSVMDMQVRSMMCAPLMGPSQQPVGILHLETNDPLQSFQREDLDVLVTIATVAGQAVENARAHQARLLLDRQQREMTMARDMQLQFLPQKRPELAGYEFFDFYHPAAQVGGDYYGYIPLNDGRLAIALADVAGKGVPAALLMARLSAETRACLREASTPAAAVERLNTLLVSAAWGDRFVTFVLCVLDPRRHEIMIVNAGHPDPLLRSPSGQVIDLGTSEKGLPLGFMADERYREARYKLEPGDIVLLYTDGVSDAHNSDEALYGSARIRQTIAAGPNRVGPLCEALLDDVELFLQGWAQTDDMCLVGFARCT